MRGLENMRKLILILALSSTGVAVAANSTVVEGLLQQYEVESGIKFSAQSGSELWQKEFVSAKTGKNRSYTTCHTSKLSSEGTHIKTKKLIEPLAPSVNDERLTKTKTINKWLKRNCKWTMGRECTTEEKGHLLTYIQSQ